MRVLLYRLRGEETRNLYLFRIVIIPIQVREMFQPTKENFAFLRGLLASGLPINDIADYLECSRRTVGRWRAKFLQFPFNFLVDARIFNGSAPSLIVDEIENIDCFLSSIHLCR